MTRKIGTRHQAVRRISASACCDDACWRWLGPYADANGIAALTRPSPGQGKDRLALAPQHPAAGASAGLPFRDEVVQFNTRLADEKSGWRDLA